MTDETRSFISFTPVVDVSFLDPILVAFLNEDLLVPFQYHEWNTGNKSTAVARELNLALTQKGVPPFTNCLLKMF